MDTNKFTEHLSEVDIESLKRAASFDNFLQAPRIDAHAAAVLVKPNPRLQHAQENSAAKGLPPISVLPLAGQYLSILTKLVKAKTVLEVGTLGGYSSICFAEAGAKVTSIEIAPKHRDVAIENTKDLDVEVLLGSSNEVMPKLAAEGRKFDLVFIDANMEGQAEQFDWAVKLTNKGGCVFLDDALAAMFKNNATGEGDTDTILTTIGADERVQATIVPVVACHPMLPTPIYNGFVFAIVL